MDTDGGYITACGTGIENCDTSSTRTSSDITDCNAGQADKRAGAYLRAASKWAVMTLKTDSSGTLLWQRVDSFETSTTQRTTSTLASSSSAGEWVVRTSDGGLAVFTDEETGFGVMKLGGTTSSSSNGAIPAG